MDFTDLGTAFGLMLVIEGLLYALLPDFMRRMMAQMQVMSTNQIRVAAVLSIAFGVGLLWLFIRILGSGATP